jgi:hypothetical protein
VLAALTLALTATLSGAISVAVAAGHGKSVHACALRSSGALSLAHHGNCPKGSNSLTWSVRGPRGARGKSATAPATLPPGHTETGPFAAGGVAASAGDTLLDSVTFGLPLPAAIDAAHVVEVAPGGDGPASCPGTAAAPSATPGYLCLYDVIRNVNVASTVVHRATVEAAGADPTGFTFSIVANGAGQLTDWGSWAVTAPAH